MLTEPPFVGDRREPGTLTVGSPARAFSHLAPPRPTPPQGVDIGLLLRTLRRRVPVIVVLMAIGVGLGTLVQRSLTPRYTSEVSLLLEPKRADSLGSETQFGSMYVDSAMIASVVSVISASDLLGRVVTQEHLDQLPEFGDAKVPLLHRWFGFLPLMRSPPVDNSPEVRFGRALYRLHQAISVDRVGLTYVVTITASAAHPEIAERIAAAVADVYLDDQVERKTAKTQRDATWIAARLAGVRRDLEQSEEALDDVRRKYGLLETDTGSGATIDQQAITLLNAQLLQARADVTSLKTRYEQIDRARATGGSLEASPEIAGSAVIQELRNSQAEGVKQLAALRAVFNDNYPDVQRLLERQNIVKQQIAAEIARIAESRRIEYETAVEHERALDQQMQHAIAGDESHQRLIDAQRLVDANRGLYDLLLTKWRQVQEQQTREEPEARIISQAALPSQPSFPKPFVLPAGGGAIMLFMGLGLTLLPVLLDNRFVSVTAVEQQLGVPVLGAIPMLRRRDLRVTRRKRSIVDYPSQLPLSRFAESLRMLRAYLRISADGMSAIIQVTSAVAGEGKSTVAATLAVSAASAGVRTLLVDADVRSSSVSTMFGMRDAAGLTDVLERGVPASSVLRDHGDMPLAILGSGSSAQPRPDLIHSSRFAALLRELSESHSLVIVDSPPVLPVSDALVICKYADATILVVQWRATPRGIVEQAAKMLRTMHAPLAGVILNKIDVTRVSQYECGYPEYHRPRSRRC